MVLAADPRIELWTLDEVTFQQHGSTCRMWIAPEDRDPVVLHHPTRKGVGYYGAVRVSDGKFVYMREDEVFNAETFFRFLKYLRMITARCNKIIVVVLDNARYHHAVLHKEWREDCDDCFILEFLPPYSPDLSVIERVWKLTRRLCTHNMYFPVLEDIIEVVESQFSQWKNGSEALRRLCAIN